VTRSRSNPRIRARASIPILVAAVAAGLIAIVGNAGAITGATISPTTLSASQQQFTITYSGKDLGTPTNPTPNLVVVECIANDSKPGFDPDLDCSPLSQVGFGPVGASGTLIYGGDPNNPTAPFVGLDPNNGEWSICDPSAAGPGVVNYQSGYFRVADEPSDSEVAAQRLDVSPLPHPHRQPRRPPARERDQHLHGDEGAVDLRALQAAHQDNPREDRRRRRLPPARGHRLRR